MNPDELDDLFRDARRRQPTLPAALANRMLSDALALQPRGRLTLRDRFSRLLALPCPLSKVLSRPLWHAGLALPAVGGLAMIGLLLEPHPEVDASGWTQLSGHAIEIAMNDEPAFAMWIIGWPEDALLLEEASTTDPNLALD